MNKKLEECFNDERVSAEKLPEELFLAYQGIYNQKVKRIVGVSIASVIVFMLSPVYLLISLFIIAESGFPVFYRAERGGYKGRAFKINKFRSMVKNADQIGGGTTALNDSRITKVGNILRKTKLDEIPQLFNIITGEMAFIGPRPELLKYTEQYKETEKLILQVRPGITDYSSIEFINLDQIVGSENADKTYEKYVLKRKNKLRLKYVATVSFYTDCKLFFLTIIQVIKKIIKFLVRKE